MDKQKICVVTGTRAEYGLLRRPIAELKQCGKFEIQLVVCGMHLSAEFGLTVNEIIAEGVAIDARVDMDVHGDSPLGICRSVSLGVAGFAEAFSKLRPDAVLILGDRYEILAAAQAALFFNIPLIHLCGGDVTEGAFDESIRHAISKMASLHFTTNEDSRARLIKMGETPERVFTVGSPGIDALQSEALMSREALEESMGFSLGKKVLLTTMHPETRKPGQGPRLLLSLLKVLEVLPQDHTLVFSGANADPEGAEMNRLVEAWTRQHKNAHFLMSLGHLRYISLLAQADVVIGNSSSGLYEAPSFGIASINVGDRQTGRLKARSVIDSTGSESDLARALQRALTEDFSDAVNPYGDGNASRKIASILSTIAFSSELCRKPFFQA